MLLNGTDSHSLLNRMSVLNIGTKTDNIQPRDFINKNPRFQTSVLCLRNSVIIKKFLECIQGNLEYF